MVYDILKPDSFIQTDKGLITLNDLANNLTIKCLTYLNGQFIFKKIIEIQRVQSQILTQYFFNRRFLFSSKNIKVFNSSLATIGINSLIINQPIKSISYMMKYSLNLVKEYEKSISETNFVRKIENLSLSDGIYLKIEDNLPLIVNDILVYLIKREDELE